MSQPSLSEPRLEGGEDGAYRLLGELTFATIPEIYRAVVPFTSANPVLDIDLSAVERTDSAGLALLVEWLRLAKAQDVSIRYRNIPPQLLALAKTSGVDDILPLNQEISALARF